MSYPEGTQGPHSSRIANAADPRIDSDRDNRAAPTTTGLQSTGLHSTGVHEPAHHATGIHEPTHHAGAGVQEGGVFSSQGTNRGFDGPATKTDGPHNSNLLNKADPRVDSDRDHSRNMGANPHGTATTGNARNTTTTTGTDRTTLGGTTTTTGTHGYNTRGTAATTGTYEAPEGTHGPHSSRVANTADPRVDSDRDHRAAPGKVGHSAGHNAGHNAGHTAGLSNTHTTGPAPNTAGPHKSDLLNKIDPRVDSDLDGSKTVGGDKTNKDPTDAAQVPPSVLQKHVGPPVPLEEQHGHGHKEKRHGL